MRFFRYIKVKSSTEFLPEMETKKVKKNYSVKSVGFWGDLSLMTSQLDSLLLCCFYDLVIINLRV